MSVLEAIRGMFVVVLAALVAVGAVIYYTGKLAAYKEQGGEVVAGWARRGFDDHDINKEGPEEWEFFESWRPEGAVEAVLVIRKEDSVIQERKGR